jgi:predicted nucleotidyltransferase component of viral defense system
MIEFDYIYDISLRSAGKDPFNEENIYVDLLLTLTMGEIQSKFDFVLKGGTAIKAHYEPYRFSYDLDFSYFNAGSSKKTYKTYQKELESLIRDMGYQITSKENEKHRSGGKIFILHLMDKAGNLKRPIKLSISSIDRQACFEPVKKPFTPVVKISKDPFELLYPESFDKLHGVTANVFTIEELCAEKIRALATRGKEDIWNLILRDIVDIYFMEKQGILTRVLKQKECAISKLKAIKDTSYWIKYKSFLNSTDAISITEEDTLIFFNESLLNEVELTRILGVIKSTLSNWKL